MRRSCFEAFGDFRWSRPASGGIDRKLANYLGRRGGFFVEAGANDGYLQSNTYYLEKAMGWRGVLVEPIPELCQRCRVQRKRSRVVQAALVADGYPEETIRLHYFNAMSYTDGAFGSRAAEARHRAEATKAQRLKRTYELQVPARTLTSVLVEEAVPRTFDLLSLDMEGYEVQALRGLDLERFRPAFILVEQNDPDAVHRVLSGHYALIEQLSERDALYRAID